MNPPSPPQLFLLDRNIVALIKEVAAGKETNDVKKQHCLRTLREIDIPTNYISPLLSIIEGEHGREDSADEKSNCQKKESDVLRQFFKSANLDSEYLDASRRIVGSVFTTYREEHWSAREEFFNKAAPLVAQKAPIGERQAIEQKLIRKAAAADLASDDVLLVLFLACLHGSDDARKVIKPTKPDAYNVLNDLHVIPRIGLIKALVRQTGIQMNVRFVTLDEGLEQVLSNIRIVESNLSNTEELGMQVRYLPGLFPELENDAFIALLTRITNIEKAPVKTTAVQNSANRLDDTLI